MLRKRREFLSQVDQLVDLLVVLITMIITYHLMAKYRSFWAMFFFGFLHEVGTVRDLMWVFILYPVLWRIGLEIVGFYHRSYRNSLILFWSLSKAIGLGVLFMMGILYILNIPYVNRSVVVGFAITSLMALWLKYVISHHYMLVWRLRARDPQNVLLAGSATEVRRWAQAIRDNPLWGLNPVGMLEISGGTAASESLQDDAAVASVDDTVPVLGGLRQISSILHQYPIDYVLLTADRAQFDQIETAILACETEGVEAWLVAEFFKTSIAEASLDEFHGRPILVFRSTPAISWQLLFKCVIDFTGALALLIFTLPIMAAAALVIKITSPGPILFRQVRSGLHGRKFTMYKFRSMVTNAEMLKSELQMYNEMKGPVFKLSQDPRVTPFGRLIRKWSIDELPQLFNVLKGHMSLVGPRPLPVYETDQFDNPSQRRRLSVKPGMTCLWQISGRNNIDFHDWIKLDLKYIDNWSIWLDIKILIQTIPVVLRGVGAK
jgi:exopolysaccharide biosynthesis polyprenyl glycosylphosphotransferase